MRRAVILLATVASTMLLVVAMGVAPYPQRQAEAQTDDEAVTGPTLQFGCDVVKVAAMDPIFDPQHPHEHVFYGTRALARTQPMSPS